LLFLRPYKIYLLEVGFKFAYQENDDCVEDEPGEKETSLPESKSAESKNIGGQGQGSKDADEDS
jgi:hypothetical protein